MGETDWEQTRERLETDEYEAACCGCGDCEAGRVQRGKDTRAALDECAKAHARIDELERAIAAAEAIMSGCKYDDHCQYVRPIFWRLTQGAKP